MDQESCYQALTARDPRFDGLIYVGVSSTGIYCRIVCPSRRPLKRNCTFFATPAAAEHAGYRPCLRCRPELAPGNAWIDARSRIAAAIAQRIESGGLNDSSVSELASDLGISDRHLRRVIQSEFGVSPNKLVETQRLLTAKLLLTDTTLAVTDVAYASGFASLRRFNDAFKTNYRMSPSRFRHESAEQVAHGGRAVQFVFDLGYRPPLDWEALLDFLARRLYAGVEAISGQAYLRTVRVGDRTGWVRVTRSPRAHALRVELAAELGRGIPAVLARVRRLFDLGADPRQIAQRLGKLARGRPGLRLPGAFDSYELAIRAVLGQQISVKAASTLAGRFSAAFGERISTPFPELCCLTPAADVIGRVAIPELMKIGITAARAQTILAVSRAMSRNPGMLDPGVDVDLALAELKALPGIGEWTAQYIAMRALSWPDAFPSTDLGIRKALGNLDDRSILAHAESWRPWRGYAAMHLWRSLT